MGADSLFWFIAVGLGEKIYDAAESVEGSRVGNAFGDERGVPGIQLMGRITDGECKGAFVGLRSS